MGDVDEEQSGENASLSQPSEQKSGLGEGEAASEVEGECVAGNESKKPAVRYRYSIALLAGEGVKIEGLQGQLENLSGAGFKILTRDAIQDATGEDEALAAEVAAATTPNDDPEAPPPEPLKPGTYARLLLNLFSEKAPEETPKLVADGAAGKLVQVENGPRSFVFFINDFPMLEDMSTLEATLEGGALDCVMLVTAPPRPMDGQDAAPLPDLSEEKQAALDSFRAEGRQRENIFHAFQAMAVRESPRQKVFADVCFHTLQLTAMEVEEGAEVTADAYDAVASSEKLCNKMLETVTAKLQFHSLIRTLTHVETKPQEINMRHYDEVLRTCPPSVVSEAMILNALIEQVEVLHAEMEHALEASAQQASRDSDAQHAHARAAAADNKAIHEVLEEALYSLNESLPVRNKLVLTNRRVDVPLDFKADKQAQRLGAPKVPQTQFDTWAVKEASVLHLLDQVLLERVPAVHPSEPEMSLAARGLEMTELTAMLPPELSPAQIRRGLIRAEMEKLVGFVTDAEGEPVNTSAWFMSDVDLEGYSMVEEHKPEALKQLLRECLSSRPSNLSGDPTVEACYYAREDVVLVAVCNRVPFSRVQRAAWRAVDREAAAPCFLGFWQWLETCLTFRKEDEDVREAALQAQRAEEEAGMDAMRTAPPAEEEEGGEEGGAAEDAPEEDEEERERKRVLREEEEAEAEREAALRGALPQFPRPLSGTWYEQDARAVRRLTHDHSVMYLSNGPRLCVAHAAKGREVVVDVGRHVLTLRPDEEAGGFRLALTYDDAACATARRVNGLTIVSLSLAEGLVVTLQSDGTVWQSRPTSLQTQGVNQAAERKRLDWGAHAASTDNVPKPRGQLVVEGDVGGSLTDQAAVNKCAIVGEGNVVLWRGDGECEILMPNACVAQSLGKGCGWLWTNAGGLRQIRGAPKAKGPVRAPPVKVERRVQAETGDVLVSRADLVLTLKRRDGTELVMHRDASEMVTYPALADDPGPRRTIKISGMAPVETGPYANQARVTMQDGSTLCLIPALSGAAAGFIEVRRRDGTMLQVALQGGKVVFEADPPPFDLSEAVRKDADARSRHSKSHGAGQRGEEGKEKQERSNSGGGMSQAGGKGLAASEGKKAGGGGDALTAKSGGSVKSFKTGKSGKTANQVENDRPAGCYTLSLVTGSIITTDYAGNTYSVTSKGEVKVVSVAEAALKQRNADAISAADEARNKMAMESDAAALDLRPPSPKIESEPPPRLEPFRLFVIRRDGSGYEMQHERIARMDMKTAAEHGRSVVEESLPAEDEEAGAVSYTVLAPDHRYPLGGSALGLRAPSEDLLPPLVRHKGLSSATDMGSVGGKPAPWTRLVLQKLVHYPPLPKATMAVLRRCIDHHRAWRREQDLIADAHYLADPRDADKASLEHALQQRIIEARETKRLSTASLSKPRASSIASPTATSPLAASSSLATAAAPARSSFRHSADRRPRPDLDTHLSIALSTHHQSPRRLEHPAAHTPLHTRPTATSHATATSRSGMTGDDGSEEGPMEAPGRGAVFTAYPNAVHFGDVPAGCVYRYKVTIANVGVDYSKFRIRQPKLSNVSVVYTPCQVAAGMSVVLWVEISAAVPDVKIQDSFSILSEVKGDVFPVPISARVVEASGGLLQAGAVLDSEGNVQVVEQLGKTVTLSMLRSKPPPVESANKLLRKPDGTQIAAANLHQVQQAGKQAKLQHKLRGQGAAPVHVKIA